MLHQHLGIDGPGHVQFVAVEQPVQTDHAREPIRTTAGKIEHAQSPETVADRGDTIGIDAFHVTGERYRSAHSGKERCPVTKPRCDKVRVVVSWIAGDALAKHIDRDANVAECSQALRDGMLFLAATRPGMCNQHRGRGAVACGPGDRGFQYHITVAVILKLPCHGVHSIVIICWSISRLSLPRLNL